MSGFKHCKLCDETLPVATFHKDRSQRDGLQTYCIACRKAAKTNPPNLRQKAATASEKKCRSCGEIKPRSDFGARPNVPSNMRALCKSCTAKATEEWRQENPEKNAAQQERTNARKRGRYSADGSYRKRIVEKQAAYFHSLPKEKRRTIQWRNWLKTTYNITPEEYDALYEKQNGRCAICGAEKDKVNLNSGTDQRKTAICVDHCHTTGKVRGLLCRSCNTAIGLLGDDLPGLMRAVAYLEAFES